MNKGKKRYYVCVLCKKSRLTIQAHDGHTPKKLPCVLTKKCEGHLQQVEPAAGDHRGNTRATYEWYRPTKGFKTRLRKLNTPAAHAVLEYVSLGGLMLRKRKS